MRPARLLLINPQVCKPHNARLPLSLLTLAAALEGRHRYRIVDANLDRQPVTTASRVIAREGVDAIGITVMPGPQLVDAVAISATLRAAHPAIPIIWGGYFPTLYPNVAINAAYVDLVVRGEGEETLLELLDRLDDIWPSRKLVDGRLQDGNPRVLADVRGLTWRRDGSVVHNPPRRPRRDGAWPMLPYEALGDLTPYHRGTFLSPRTSVHQAATGCRYHCRFCGVASMYGGATALQDPGRLRQHLLTLRDRYGVSSMMYYDNNFFDSEETARPLLEVLASVPLPYWCYGRADTLARLSPAAWQLVQRSGLRMVYIGAESPDDGRLRALGKGGKAAYTLEAAIRCREHGVLPELSFIVGDPEDPEADIDRTFAFIREVKRRVREAEIVLYFYTPMPQRDPAAWREAFTGTEVKESRTYGAGGLPLPETPEGWADPRWVRYVCHTDAPWLTPRLRRRVHDFARVLSCRFPTAQDIRTPPWGKRLLSMLARWRYTTGLYHYPVELSWLHARLRMRVPEAESL
ncbi:MAG TPA: radical SAM protein [Vicinamibacterales bacterium]